MRLRSKQLRTTRRHSGYRTRNSTRTGLERETGQMRLINAVHVVIVVGKHRQCIVDTTLLSAMS